MLIENEPLGARSKYRLRFSLLALFLFITVVCVVLALVVQPNRVVATALFRVSSRPDSIIGDNTSEPADAREFEALKKTQVALLKSYFVLNAAMRKPGIAALPIFQNVENPEDWLQRHLEVEFPQDGEVLSISLRGTQSQSTDLARIVDAVVAAYSDEVLYKARATGLGTRDLIARSLRTTTNDIMEKTEQYRELSRETGASREAKRVMRQLTLSRIERVDAELMRLENEQAMQQAGDDGKGGSYFDKRIEQLRAQQAELEKELAESAEESAELSALESELRQLRQVADELTAKLLRLEIDSNAPPRIEQIQPAVVSPDD